VLDAPQRLELRAEATDPPPAATVGHRELLSRPQSQHPFEVVAVGVVENGVLEIGDKRVRVGHAADPPVLT
jgi:hypothetical protein